MSNKAKVNYPAILHIVSHHYRLQVSLSTLSPIIFRDTNTAPLGRKLLSLFPGLGYAAGYKITQRVYKFGGQPWFNDLIAKHFKAQFTDAFGERKGKMMIQATAGSLTGIGEVVCLDYPHSCALLIWPVLRSFCH